MDTIALQNDRLLVQALPEQGALALTDKQTGVTFRQANSGMQFLRLSCTAKEMAFALAREGAIVAQCLLTLGDAFAQALAGLKLDGEKKEGK